MASATLCLCLLLSCLMHVGAIDESEDSKCVLSKAGKPDRSLLQRKQSRNHLVQGSAKDEDNPGDAIDIGPYGLSVVPQKLLNRLVMSNPYKCKFVPGYPSPNDPRSVTCDKDMLQAGLYPLNAPTHAERGLARLDAIRALLPIGALPCCTTPPFCAAPDCSMERSLDMGKPVTCTMRAPAANFAYMVHPDVWPAYRLAGGSLDLDVQKHWDVLAKLQGIKPALPTFDLVIDVGVNFGMVTEKLAMRRFAKDYIMIDAWTALREVYNARFGNASWRQEFLAEQVTTWEGAQPFEPDFEFLNFAVSDKSGGFIDTCSFNSLQDWSDNCSAEVATLDAIIPARLSPEFITKFVDAKSAYVKVDAEGMDQLAFSGMQRLLSERRGEEYLVNFMMLEFCAPCMQTIHKQNLTTDEKYDLQTFVYTLNSQGFEVFLVGPRYIPLSHGNWDDAFNEFAMSPENEGCNATLYPKFKELLPEIYPEGECREDRRDRTTFTADLFAMRAGHPKADEIKLALGSCEESHDFSPEDSQYDLKPLDVAPTGSR